MQQIYLSSYQYAYYSFETNWKILLKTSEKGIILEPTPKLKVDCYVNADFAGLWNREDHNDENCIKSRTGYVLCISKWLVLWIT